MDAWVLLVVELADNLKFCGWWGQSDDRVLLGRQDTRPSWGVGCICIRSIHRAYVELS